MFDESDWEAEFGELTEEDRRNFERLKNKKPTWRQSRYYLFLCRSLGIPKDVALFHLKEKYKNAGLLFLRVKKLQQLVKLTKLLDKEAMPDLKNVDIALAELRDEFAHIQKSAENERDYSSFFEDDGGEKVLPSLDSLKKAVTGDGS